ncbi:germ cell nuclear acidic protein [Scophthalmus maximus]|uniref:germ cell nuclear acidic protein n=1 Tax=Scophthalmus maximus TaxID=52904 RepID=UPI001FA8C7B6|nr:germ cell nuclear acidic protein [Scophthalmus maximus]XP_035505275.2 germ cell nuclear acidic protein [Scophthalmus maximus]XP_035505276.2 germ cell nuclear acidic protein [Scophthalmus maximus]
MNDDNCKLFERVAAKMGWSDKGGLDTVEKKLMSTIGKTRLAATSGHRPVDRSASPVQLVLSGSEDDPEKENQRFKSNEYRSKWLTESSDDDFDQFLVGRATPKAKPPAQKTCSAAKKDSSNVHVVSSDEDDGFETFLQRVKTPSAKPRELSKSASEDSLKSFIVNDFSSDDDFIDTNLSLKVPKKSNTPAAQLPLRRPMSQWESPVFVSDSDDDDNIVVKSTWRTRHTKPKPPATANKDNALLCDKDNSSPSMPLLPVPSPFPFRPHDTPTPPASPKRTLSAPGKLDDSASSEEEFTSLLERLKRKNQHTSTTHSPKNTKEYSKEPPVFFPPVKGRTTSATKTLAETPLNVKTPGKLTTLRPTVSQTEPRHGPTSRVVVCKTPGCFLQSLSLPGSTYGQRFKQNKGDLTSRLYQLYNISVFDSKLPVDMQVTWNKKMRKTAGYCITGQERGGGSRYARIELSEKVCDSADRLRDTLIHEMCHAATWLINGARDGHGTFWKLYARKATVVHPELPMVTRCHSYDIKYKFQYQCTRCQNSIGRHSKSLDTQRFVCALCTGQLVLLTPSKPRAPTPFANFVKENYGTARQELVGQSHGEVMRKLSADFASKTKLSQS